MRSLCSLFGLALFVILFAAPAGRAQQPAATNELVRAREIYQGQLAAIAGEAGGKLAGCDSAFLNALNVLEKEFQTAGDLHGVLAVKGEKFQLKPDENAQVTGVSPLPQKVQTLRTGYLEARKKVETDQAAQVQALNLKYIAHLEALKREFTRKDRINEALSADAEIGIVKRAAEAANPAAATVEPAPDPAVAAAENLEKRLQEIAIPQMRYYTSGPIAPINELIDYCFPKGISLKIDTTKINVMSVYYDSGGKPRYSQRYDAMAYREPSRHVQLQETTARDALQSICDTFALGYLFEKDLIVLTDPDHPRAVWARLSVTAEELAGEFTADNLRAVDKYIGKPVRITGTLAGINKTLAGHTYLLLQAPRPVRIEWGRQADAAPLATLQQEFDRMREQQRYNQPQPMRSPVRRMGEPPPAPAPHMPTLRVSMLVQYQGQTGQTIVFENPRDLWWQRLYPRP